MTVAQTLANYGSTLHETTLPSDVLHHAKRAVLDWYAALIPGAVEAPARMLELALAGDLDRGPSQLALGRSATPRTAALINGTAAHTVEVDDIYRHAIYHPGAPTIAAALAQAQAIDASGLDFLKGVVAGYEISTRIGASLGRAHYRFWHNTGTVGTFGAAAAASTLLQLDAARYAHALCTGATMASGLQQAFRMDSMSKPLHAGHAAEAGLLAALAAAAGLTGSLDVIDGDAG
ncbi:MAG: MmgE/PrpD family protein, partial [Hydrogenophaga sp.]|nr:MmgE/PrpD family protein [Hydrogenophaga sp.]